MESTDAQEKLRRPEDGTAKRWLLALVMLGLVGIYAATSAQSLTWANYGSDGGDLVASVLSGGVPHPTGYPIYLLLASPFSWPSVGNPALRQTWLSILCMAGATTLLAGLAVAGLDGRARQRLAAGVLVGLCFGLAPIPWSQAVIVEVYALQALFIALSLLLIFRLGQGVGARTKLDVLLAIGVGLGLGNHLTFVFMIPAILAAGLFGLPRRASRRSLLWLLLLPAAGALVYLVLPLRALGNPPVDWGDTSTLAGFWWEVSGIPYRGLAFGLPVSDLPARLAAWAKLLVDQFGVVGLGLGIVGLVYGRSRQVWMDRTTYWMMVAYSIFAIGYNTPDSMAYLIPAYIAFCWWIGNGVLVLMRAFPQRLGYASWMVPLVLAASLGLRTPGVWASVSARHDERADRFVACVAAEATQNAIVFTSSTADSFALWYMQFAEQLRPDLRVVVTPLLQFPWYRKSISATYPDLTLPRLGGDDPGAWTQGIQSNNARPVCQTVVGTDPSSTVSMTCGQPSAQAACHESGAESSPRLGGAGDGSSTNK